MEQLGFIDWSKIEGVAEKAFGADNDLSAMKHLIIVAQWVVLSQRFGVARARPLV